MSFEQTKEFLKDNPGLVITFVYIYASAIGIVSEIALLATFDIPVLYFTASSDLLFYGLRDWVSLVFGVLPAAFLLLGQSVIDYATLGSRTIAQKYLSVATLFLTLIMVPGFAISDAILASKQIKENLRRSTDINILYDEGNSKANKRVQLIDANASFFFLWDYNKKQVTIVPARNVFSIQPSS